MLPPSLLRAHSFVSGCGVYLLTYLALAGVMFYVTLLFQNVEGWSPFRTGVSWLSMNIPFIITAQFAGRLRRRFQPVVIVVGGCLAGAVGVAILALLSDTTSFAVAFVGSWALCLQGRPGRAPSEGAPYRGIARTLFLLVLSYYFYASWNWRYLPLIFGSSTVDFFLARAIAREERPHARKVMLALTVALNLGFLGFFKYWNFALENALTLKRVASRSIDICMACHARREWRQQALDRVR